MYNTKHDTKIITPKLQTKNRYRTQENNDIQNRLKQVQPKSILIKSPIACSPLISTRSKNVSFFPYSFIDSDKDINANTEKNADHYLFLKSLGKVYYFIIEHTSYINEEHDNKIVGTACGILRNYSLAERDIVQGNGKDLMYWYLYDIDIDKSHCGNNLTNYLFSAMFKKFSNVTRRGYLITLNEQIIHIMGKMNNMIRYESVKTMLLVYYVSANDMATIERFFSCAFGNISYISITGSKYLPSETDEKMKIYHLQHGLFASKSSTVPLCEVPSDATIMFCFPDTSSLKNILEMFGFCSNNSLTILSWGMRFFDWHEILTSEF